MGEIKPELGASLGEVIDSIISAAMEADGRGVAFVANQEEKKIHGVIMSVEEYCSMTGLNPPDIWSKE